MMYYIMEALMGHFEFKQPLNFEELDAWSVSQMQHVYTQQVCIVNGWWRVTWDKQN